MREKKKLLIVLLIESVLLFCASGAYFFWFSKTSILLSLFAVLFPLIVSTVIYNKLDYSKWPYMLFFMLFFTLHSYVTNGSFLYTVIISIIPLYLLVPATIKTTIIDFYVLKAFPIVLAISVGFYVLEGLNITHLPVFPVEPLNDAKQYYYISHFFFLQDSDALFDFARFNSYYEECGVLGSMIAIFLFSHGERMPVLVKAVYILSGLLTFSLFFFIMFAFYLITSLRGSKRSLVWMILIVCAIGYFVIINYDSDFVDAFFFNRLEIDNGKWVGNDREDDYFMTFFWNDFVHSSDLWFGTTRVKSEGWSIFRCIVENGIIIVAFTVLLYLGYILRNKSNKKKWVYSIVFLAMFYQRPEFWSTFYFIIFTTISDATIDAHDSNDKSNKRIVLLTNIADNKC